MLRFDEDFVDTDEGCDDRQCRFDQDRNLVKQGRLAKADVSVLRGRLVGWKSDCTKSGRNGVFVAKM